MPFLEGLICSLGASLIPAKIVSCRYSCLQALPKLKSLARVWGRRPSPSPTICFLHLIPLHLLLRFPSRRTYQTSPMRLANSHWPLDNVVNSSSFPNPTASIKTFGGMPGWFRSKEQLMISGL